MTVFRSASTILGILGALGSTLALSAGTGLGASEALSAPDSAPPEVAARVFPEDFASCSHPVSPIQFDRKNAPYLRCTKVTAQKKTRSTNLGRAGFLLIK
jgi:hypothetical protein